MIRLIRKKLLDWLSFIPKARNITTLLKWNVILVAQVAWSLCSLGS